MNNLIERHNEISLTVRRIFYTKLIFSFFCALTLLKRNVSLGGADSDIKIPFANVEVSLNEFLIIGPLILILITLYLHIFLGYLNGDVNAIPPESKKPFIFNFPEIIPRFVSTFFFYYFTPFMLLYFTWKSWPRPDANNFLYVTYILTLFFLFLDIKRCSSNERLLNISRGIIIFVLITAAFFIILTEKYQFGSKINIYGGYLQDRDLRGFNLKGANIIDSDLSKVNLDGSNLANVNFEKSNLIGASLINANLKDAKLFQAILSESNLTEAKLFGAILKEADLKVARLKRAKLNNANLESANLLNADLSEADLTGANLEVAILEGANLIGTNLFGAFLKKANLNGTNMKGAQLNGAYMESAGLNKAKMQGAILEGADLRGAELNGAFLNDANLISANLYGADLTGADLSGADLERAKLEDAILYGVNLTNTKGLTKEQIDLAKTNKETKVPKNLQNVK